MKMNSTNDLEKIGANLWKHDNKYYRLFASGITPNGCWLINPIMRELRDIDIATGKDVLGDNIIEFDVTGTVPASYQFVISYLHTI